MVVLHPKITQTIGSLSKNSITDVIKGADTTQLLKVGAFGGAALGLTKAVYDDVDDDILTTGSKMAVTATLGAVGTVGAKEGIKYVSNRIDKVNAEDVVKSALDAESENRRLTAEAQASKIAANDAKNSRLTAGKIAQEKPKAQHDAAATKQARKDQEFKDGKMKKMNRWKSAGGVAGLAGLGAFAVASVMDTSSRLGDQREVSRMTEEQERNLTRKQSQQQKKNRESSYGYVDMGEIAFEMFENRLGHHKMGNAKFE